MPDPSARRSAGFTVIELAIVLAVAALLLRVALPNLTRTAAAHALSAQAAEFMGALRFARAQALLRGTPVTVCASAPGASPLACRGAPAADWRGGWIVFADLEPRGLLDARDTVLRVQQPLAASGGVAGTRGSISFTAAGFSVDGASHYLFSPAGSAADAPPPVLVCVSKQGRPRLSGIGRCA